MMINIRLQVLHRNESRHLIMEMSSVIFPSFISTLISVIDYQTFEVWIMFVDLNKPKFINFKQLNFMKRAQLKKQSSGAVLMTMQNLKICASNQEGFETLYLNDSLQLQHYNFCKIQNLQQCIHIQSEETQGNNSEKSTLKNVQSVNTLFLNNNLIDKIQNLSPLSRTLVTLNLSHNKITQFEGLRQLVNLSVLDLSHNLIEFIHQNEISPLQKLARLNLNSNKFASKQSIQGICAISESLETLELNSNSNFTPEPQFLSDVLSKMSKLKVLMLKDTPFTRMTPSYRKQVILSVSTLTFLDERPVTEDERFLTLAWKKGGLKEEQEARKTIKQQKQQKNAQILKQIQHRNSTIDGKVQQVFALKAKDLLSQLEMIREKLKGEDSELLTSDEESVIRLKIEELERYLELLKEQCRSLDLDHELGIKKVQLPKMIVQNRTNDCIYIYHVDESQLPLIKEKYYAEQKLPLKAVNYEQKKELEWLEEYDTILSRLYTLCKGNWEMILPSFNLEIYDFDLNCGRKLKRFSEEYVRKKFLDSQSKNVNSKELERLEQKNAYCQNQRHNHLDSLD